MIEEQCLLPCWLCSMEHTCVCIICVLHTYIDIGACVYMCVCMCISVVLVPLKSF